MRSGKMESQRIEVREGVPALEHARFAAGIIGLYEAVLREPIPRRMLRLLEEIGQQERKS
jgi:hypothetical protein